MAFEICPGEAPDVFLLEGELDVATAGRLDPLLEMTDREIVLDVERLTFIDSSGLRAVLRLALEHDDDRPVTLRRPSSVARRVLELTVPDGVPGLRIVED
jgi:anti-anti-sigma factor